MSWYIGQSFNSYLSCYSVFQFEIKYAWLYKCIVWMLCCMTQRRKSVQLDANWSKACAQVGGTAQSRQQPAPRVFAKLLQVDSRGSQCNVVKTIKASNTFATSCSTQSYASSQLVFKSCANFWRFYRAVTLHKFKVDVISVAIANCTCAMTTKHANQG